MGKVFQPCCDCGRSTQGEFYRVYDDIWNQAFAKKPAGRFATQPQPGEPGGTFLCVVCLEKRLGRKLNRNDFEQIPMNYNPEMVRRKNLRLQDRLERKPDDEKPWPSVKPKLAKTWYQTAMLATAKRIKHQKGHQGMEIIYDIENKFTHKMVLNPDVENAANESVFGKSTIPTRVLWGDPAHNFWGTQPDAKINQLDSSWYGAPPPGWDPTKAIPENRTFFETDVPYDVS